MNSLAVDISTLSRHKWAVLITVIYVCTALLYALLTPIFEVSDEVWHYPVIHHIASKHQLPVQNSEIKTAWNQEGSQPPLYYVLGASVASLFDLSDFDEVRRLNPHAKIGLAADPDNKNIALHSRSSVGSGWKGTAGAVHTVRVLSIGFSTATILLVYLAVCETDRGNTIAALLAMTLTAFNPMFLHIMSSVNNDTLASTLGAWLTVLLLRTAREGLTPKRSILLGIVFACGILTKVSLISFSVVILGTLVFTGVKTGDWRKSSATFFGVVILSAAIAGWWYYRNLVLYGEPLGINMMVSIVGARDPASTLLDITGEWYGFWLAFWAYFGMLNILLPTPYYFFFGAVSILSTGSITYWVIRQIKLRNTQLVASGALALSIIFVLFASLVRWTSITHASQGRLMFPGIAAMNLLAGMSIYGLLPRYVRKWFVGVVCIVFMSVSYVSLFTTILPTYAGPDIVTDLPEHVIMSNVTYGGFEIIGIAVEQDDKNLSDVLRVTMYYRANSQIEQNYSLSLVALGSDYSRIGSITTYPGGGMLPSSEMAAGIIYRDSYVIKLRQKAYRSQLRFGIGVSFLEGNTLQPVTGNDRSGNQIRSIIIEDLDSP